jgi:hypothetical protein
MTTQETKIELVTEAVEALVLATVTAHVLPDTPNKHQNISDARGELARALKELLTPTLRLVG